MARQLFVNLPVSDLAKTVDFFTQLGFTFDANFTDESATCMIINDQAFAMLLVQDRFSEFTSKEICDTTTHTEVLLAVSVDSRRSVDELVSAALDAGGRPANDPQDHGFMYSRSFQDLDSHIWEVLWMDPEGVPQ